MEGNRAELTLLRQLDIIKLLALLRPGHMCRDKRVHERLEIWPPPLRQRLANLPLALCAYARELIAHRRESLVQSGLETFDLFVLGSQIITWQLKKGIGDLQHQDVRVIVLMADEDTFAGATHAVLVVMLFQALEAREN